MNTRTERTHDTVVERALTGTWVLDEVRLAVQKVYEVVKIYKVCKYRGTEYDLQTREGGLFIEYINTFQKLKAEASGYPSWFRTPEDEDRYIQDFYVSDLIRLDKDAIRPNAAKRGLAKLCFSSTRRRLTERNNRTKSKMITDPKNSTGFWQPRDRSHEHDVR